MTDSRPYRLVEYDPGWVDLFNQHAGTIKDILGPIALGVHHIGSTSVPGMMAKPNIDIEVVVSNLDDVRKLSSRMVEAGYTPPDYEKLWAENRKLVEPNQKKLAELQEQTRTKIRAILTEEQVKKYNEYNERRRQPPRRPPMPRQDKP